MAFWSITAEYLRNHGGVGPPCDICGGETFSIDEDGTFKCMEGHITKIGDQEQPVEA